MSFDLSAISSLWQTGAANAAGSSSGIGASSIISAIASKLPNLLSNSNGGNNSIIGLDTIQKTNTGEKDVKDKTITDTLLKLPGSAPESKNGELGAKIGKPIGNIVGTVFFGWCGGSLWGGMAGEDIGGKIGDIFTGNLKDKFDIKNNISGLLGGTSIV